MTGLTRNKRLFFLFPGYVFVHFKPFFATTFFFGIFFAECFNCAVYDINRRGEQYVQHESHGKERNAVVSDEEIAGQQDGHYDEFGGKIPEKFFKGFILFVF